MVRWHWIGHMGVFLLTNGFLLLHWLALSWGKTWGKTSLSHSFSLSFPSSLEQNLSDQEGRRGGHLHFFCSRG